MLFLMVGCVFTGCCAVAWEGRQIRMDVVVNALPAKARDFLALLSELVMIGDLGRGRGVRLAGHHASLPHSTSAARRRTFRCSFRRAVPLGYILMALLVGAPAAARTAHGRGAAGSPAVLSAAMTAYLVYFGLPVLLLILGFPIFLILLVTSIVAVLSVADAPPEVIQT